MKKALALILAIVMMFSVTGVAVFAEDAALSLDEQIMQNAKSIISQFVPEPSNGLLEVIAAANKLLNFLAPVRADVAPEISSLTIETGDNAAETFKTSYKISTAMDFSTLRTNIITMYEYRVFDGKDDWSEWGYVLDESGVPVVFTRFNYGYVKDAANGTKYNESFTKNKQIAADTKVYSSPSLSKMASINNLEDGTKYEIRVILTVNNSYATTTKTSGNFPFVKGA